MSYIGGYSRYNIRESAEFWGRIKLACASVGIVAVVWFLGYVVFQKGKREGFNQAVSCVRAEAIWGRGAYYDCDIFPLQDGETLWEETCGRRDQ